MIDQTVFNNKKAAYYTLGCKLNFAGDLYHWKAISRTRGTQGASRGKSGYMRGEYLLRNGTGR